MIYGLIVGLTFIFSWFIIRVVTKKRYKKFNRVLYRQSDMHNIMKRFFSIQLQLDEKAPTQLQKRIDANNLKVLMIEDEAYWVVDNIFYVAKADEGIVIPETARPVNTSNMSTKDINRLLFILDNLKNGSKNDSGGTGNK
jgi:hypothetical protein